MPGDVTLVPHGGLSRRWLEERIAEAQRLDPLAPVTVVVASWRVAQRLRRTTPIGPGTARRTGRVNVRFVVLDDVVAACGEDSLVSSGRRRLTRAALDAATRCALEAAPGGFEPVADHPGTVEELVARYEELREAGGDAAARLARRGGHARDVGRLALDIRRRLEGGWYDDIDLLDAARSRLANGPAPVDLGTVLLYLPERLSQSACDFLATLSHFAPLSVAMGTVDDEIGDRPVGRIIELLAAVGFSVATGGRPSAGTEVPFPLAARVPVPVDEVLAAADAGDEVRAAMRLVIEHLEAGGKPEECALLYSSARLYAPLVYEAFRASGLPIDLGAEAPLSTTCAARLLVGLYRLVATGGEISRDELITWIGAAPMHDRSGRLIPTGEWDRATRLAGVVSAAPLALARRLRRTATDLADRAERALARSPDEAPAASAGDSARSERDRRTQGACSAMADFLEWIVPGIETGRTLRGWQSIAQWSEFWLSELLAGRHRATGVDSPGSSPMPGTDRVLAVLAELAELDDLDPDPSCQRFAAAFEAACAIGRVSSSDRLAGVVIGDLPVGLGMEFNLVVAVGAVEGALPGGASSSHLLDAADRSACGLDSLSVERVVERDRRALIGAFAGAARRVVTHAEWDTRSGRALLRSRFLPPSDTQVISSFARVLPDVRAGGLPAIDTAELECAFLAGPSAPAPLDMLAGVDERAQASFSAGYAAVLARRAHAFDRHSGRVGPVRPEGDAVRIDSATGLETYATCPFRYYLAKVVACEQIDPPERKLTIEPRDRGSLVHEILEHFIGGIIAADAHDRARGDGESSALTVAESQASMLEIAEEMFASYARRGLTGRDLLWSFERVRILDWLERERRADVARRRAGTIPVAVELRFGSSEHPPVVRDLASGSLGFRGMIDRLDRSGGLVEVIDYKTGSAKDYEGLTDDCVDRGRHLQLPIYALAARDALASSNDTDHSDLVYRATYRFVGDSPREIGFDIGDREIARLDDVLDVLAAGVERGAFPMRPGVREYGAFKNCRFCDFARCCPGDRDGFWETAQTSPELAAYSELIDPSEFGGRDDEEMSR